MHHAAKLGSQEIQCQDQVEDKEKASYRQLTRYLTWLTSTRSLGHETASLSSTQHMPQLPLRLVALVESDQGSHQAAKLPPENEKLSSSSQLITSS